jgi:hypothetical protein
MERVVLRCRQMARHTDSGGLCTLYEDRSAGTRAVAGQRAPGSLVTIWAYRRFPGQDFHMPRRGPSRPRRVHAPTFQSFREASVEKPDETEARGRHFRLKERSPQSLVQSAMPELTGPGTLNPTQLTCKLDARRRTRTLAQPNRYARRSIRDRLVADTRECVPIASFGGGRSLRSTGRGGGEAATQSSGLRLANRRGHRVAGVDRSRCSRPSSVRAPG